MANEPPVQAVAYPPDTYDDRITYKRSERFTAHMPEDVLRELYDRGCVEVTGLPACNLTNPVHDLYRQAAFPGFTDEEYEFIRPAVLLASRLVSEHEYMGFWTHMYSGQTVHHGTAGWQRIETPATQTQTTAQLLIDTRAALNDMATRMTFFCWDGALDSARPGLCAESFANADDFTCKRHRSLNKNASCGTCSTCTSMSNHARCFVCRDTCYDLARYTKGFLEDLLDARGIDHDDLRLKPELVYALEIHDRQNHPLPAVFAASDAQLNDLRIGLRNEVIIHIREAVQGNRWSDSEELRFQFALASTLVHETVHQFWQWQSRRCWMCDAHCPYWSRDDPREDFDSQEGPELGNSWELWAFGSLAMSAGKVREQGDPVRPNIFQRCQWFSVPYTLQGGHNENAQLQFDIVVPVEYISDWFQEA